MGERERCANMSGISRWKLEPGTSLLFSVFYICYCCRVLLPRLINISTKPKKLNQLIKCYAFVNSIGHFVISRWISVPYRWKANYVLRHTTLHPDLTDLKRKKCRNCSDVYSRASHFSFISSDNLLFEFQSKWKSIMQIT